jgi:outer membrane protein OmpA-like peptidoglycan-associated protein
MPRNSYEKKLAKTCNILYPFEQSPCNPKYQSLMSIILISRLTEQQRNELKKGVIEVRGKAMNRTAMGVVDAMFTLFPKATFAEMKEMLPDSINPSAPKNYKSLFNPYNPSRLYGVIQPSSIIDECNGTDIDVNNSHFTDQKERFRTADGVEVLVSRTWESSDTVTGENDIQKLINHVQQFGVRVVQLDKKEAFNKGDYHLEIINPTLLSEIQSGSEKKGMPWWIWLLVGLLLLGCFLWFRSCNSPKETAPPQTIKANNIPAPVKESATVAMSALDSVAKDIEEGESVDGRKVTFRNIPFSKGKTDLLSGSDSILNQVSSFLKKFTDIEMEIIGHCSDEGSPKFNASLSEARAKAVYQHLIGDSIAANRLIYKGMGSASPLATGSSDSARALNRRTEFIIKQNDK